MVRSSTATGKQVELLQNLLKNTILSLRPIQNVTIQHTRSGKLKYLHYTFGTSAQYSWSTTFF